MINSFEKPPGKIEAPKVVKCPTCNGSGKDNNNKSCKSCQGTGKITDR